jgi:hypothetical protein
MRLRKERSDAWKPPDILERVDAKLSLDVKMHARIKNVGLVRTPTRRSMILQILI